MDDFLVFLCIYGIIGYLVTIFYHKKMERIKNFGEGFCTAFFWPLVFLIVVHAMTTNFRKKALKILLFGEGKEKKWR